MFVVSLLANSLNVGDDGKLGFGSIKLCFNLMKIIYIDYYCNAGRSSRQRRDVSSRSSESRDLLKLTVCKVSH